MWHDTGSGASELPSGGWLEPGEHSESPATKRRLKNLLDATGLTDRLFLLRHARPPSRSSAASTRRRTSTASRSCRRAVAATLGARLRSATARSRSRSSPPVARSRRSTRCSTARSTTPTRLFALPVTTRFPISGWGSASSRTSPSASGTRRPRGASGGSPSSTGTSTTATERRPCSGTTRRCSRSRSIRTVSTLHARVSSRKRVAGRRRHDPEHPAARGVGNGCLSRRVDRVVVPALEAFAPELIVVACGFDAGALDPLGRMLLPAAAFGEMTASARAAAWVLRRAPRRLARGRLLGRACPVLRAGRDRDAVGALSGNRRPIRVPGAVPGQAIEPTSRPRSSRRRCSLPACRVSFQGSSSSSRELDADPSARPARTRRDGRCRRGRRLRRCHGQRAHRPRAERRGEWDHGQPA